MQAVTLSLYRFDSLAARLWAFGQMATARFALKALPEIGFFKLCGSGTGEGFTPIPNTGVYAILATWPDAGTARRVMDQARVFCRYAAMASETCTLYLGSRSARGAWSGQAPFETSDAPIDGPIAALTRATLKPSVALRFWRRVPDISQLIGEDPNVMFKIGVGEVPLLHQVTFSIWPDAATMAGFARADGPHARAIRAVREERWFSEELYARFSVDDVTGTWEGRVPLQTTKKA
ncbi:spheroidene monooxygenase [Boseongicola sp. H5]|uniref:spheroidene monooxygenase n=1 Tax=Boseongicola sp. H5 TaxID=2763261 RepID=UPI001D0AC3D6|nr:spheroidene monooxygenase [Boseongicola sp. H5]